MFIWTFRSFILKCSYFFLSSYCCCSIITKSWIYYILKLNHLSLVILNKFIKHLLTYSIRFEIHCDSLLLWYFSSFLFFVIFLSFFSTFCFWLFFSFYFWHSFYVDFSILIRRWHSCKNNMQMKFCNFILIRSINSSISNAVLSFLCWILLIFI